MIAAGGSLSGGGTASPSEATLEAAFLGGISGFLASEEGLQYSQSVVLQEKGVAGSPIVATCLDGFFPGDLKDSGEQEKLVADVRRIVDAALDKHAFVFSYPILLWEVGACTPVPCHVPCRLCPYPVHHSTPQRAYNEAVAGRSPTDPPTDSTASGHGGMVGPYSVGRVQWVCRVVCHSCE